ncbi:riboflavin synthase [Dinghuibacter silviterrae]|uniref:Riboflavin synthase n=1 Tax=Dinghuibacter silviterrae TaxID=1539049 RepID=A0A4R8DEA1_9BACT|nr:riboflavin synthase [Dinghuibacter silviterrae]TDW95849.1 riboflavin synthase alpha chain [Dinghuibacter silviterrae]
MFTGIIESLGKIHSVSISGTNKTFWVSSPLSSGFKVDQSVSHSGACLTVEEVKGDLHRVTAIQETLDKTNLGSWKEGTLVNLERCMQQGGRLDGHIVQGHVDTTGTCTGVKDLHGSWEYRISFPPSFAPLVIEKGSISLNGISLTIFDVALDAFSVAIIPYTYTHTTMQTLRPGDTVNIEFDMIGKYVQRQAEVHLLAARA